MLIKKLVFVAALALSSLSGRLAFATWDVTVPSGSEAKSLGDDRIRELKTDIQTSLQFEGDFPGPDSANPRYIWTPSSGTTSQRPTGYNAPYGKFFINISSGCIELNAGSTTTAVWQCIDTTSTISQNGFNLSSGTINTFFSSSASVTLLNLSTITWKTGYIQSNPLFINIKDSTNSVVNGLGVNDDTVAFQRAIDDLPDGGMLYIPAGTYKITSQIDIKNSNRITIFGDGLESNINYTPTANDTRAFLIDGSMDNITFWNFGITQTNPGTRTGTSAFAAGSGATRLTWDHVYITGFSRYGLNLSSNYYVMVKDCRFIRIRDTTSTFVATAINAAVNDMTVMDSQFSENDQVITFSGTTVSFIRNAAEVDGNSGNALIDRTFSFSSAVNLIFSGNYIEGEDTNGGDVLRLINCVNPLIQNNLFNGLDGASQTSDDLIRVEGSSTRNVRIDGNRFFDPNPYFIDATVPVKATNNYFEDASVEITSHSYIMSKVSFPEMVELDVPVFMGYDPVILSSGSLSITSDQFHVEGSSINDSVEVFIPGNYPSGLQGIQHSAYVNQNGNAVIILNNNTGSAVNLSSGTWGVRIRKPRSN